MKTISNFKFPISNSSNERGVALVVVLWIFIFLFVVALDFGASVREEGTAASRYAEETEGYYLALAGFERELYRLVQQASRPRLPQPSPGEDTVYETWGSWREGSLEQGHYRVRRMDEGGKVSLNRADEETLRLVFTNLGVEEPGRSILVDSILDWRDEDNLHRLNGAEDDYYLSLAPSYKARNGPFTSVEDLLWVRGVTSELFYGEGEEGGLRAIFTVDSPIDRVNARTMSAEVCHALAGLSLERCRNFVEERKRLSEKTLADILRLLGVGAGEAVPRQFVFTQPFVITIEAVGYRAASPPQRQVSGVVRLLGGDRGFELIRWVDRSYYQGDPEG